MITRFLITAVLNSIITALTARERVNAMRPRSSSDYMLERWFTIVMAVIIASSIVLFIVNRIQRRGGK